MPVTEALDALEELPAVLVRSKTDALTLRLLPLTTLNEFSFLRHFIAKTRGWSTDPETTLHEDTGADAAGKAGLGLIARDRLIHATPIIRLAPRLFAFLKQGLAPRHQRVLIV